MPIIFEALLRKFVVFRDSHCKKFQLMAHRRSSFRLSL